MEIYLRDKNPAMCEAWEKYFKNCENVHISCGDIFGPGDHLKAEAIVSPANSFGFMDGGIDYAYSVELGWGMSRELQEIIDENHNGELLVGLAEVVNIHNTNPLAIFKWLISAPTMRVPTNVARTVNAYLAFRAILERADGWPFNSILCPGLGTAVGEMPHIVCALQMYEAYTRHGKHKRYTVLSAAHMRHYMLMTPNAYDMNLQAGQ